MVRARQMLRAISVSVDLVKEGHTKEHTQRKSFIPLANRQVGLPILVTLKGQKVLEPSKIFARSWSFFEGKDFFIAPLFSIFLLRRDDPIVRDKRWNTYKYNG